MGGVQGAAISERREEEEEEEEEERMADSERRKSNLPLSIDTVGGDGEWKEGVDPNAPATAKIQPPSPKAFSGDSPTNRNIERKITFGAHSRQKGKEVLVESAKDIFNECVGRASEASEAFEHPQGQPHGVFELLCDRKASRHYATQYLCRSEACCYRFYC